MSGIQLMFVGGGGGKQVINLTISSPAYNYDVYTNRGPTYVAGNSEITVTIGPGVTVGSTSTGSYAFLVPSAFNPGDTVTVVNQGVIQGRGGDGGSAATVPGPGNGQPGQTGGAAVFVNRPTTITNNGTLAGGGGGGGAGSGAQPDSGFQIGGGGGGGGAGFNGGSGGSGRGNPGISPPFPAQPGSPGTSPAGGSGGSGVTVPLGPPNETSGTGGAGGGRGASGSSGQSKQGVFSGGGGGGAGAYIVGQPFVTYPAVGTRQGPSS
jgi:hypothetical protein